MTKADEVRDLILDSLQDATTAYTPFTLGFLGTVDSSGGPRVRAVILRAFDREACQIYLATNIASDKVAEIGHTPQVGLTMNDDAHKIQLRVEGQATIVEDPAERARVWERFGPQTRHLYAYPLPPGSPRPDTVPEPLSDAEAFTRFAWVRIDAQRLEWLDLSTDPHQRWILTRSTDSWNPQNIVP